MVITACSFHACLPQGGWRVVCLTALCALRNHTPVCAVPLWGCTLPLEGTGLVVWFAGRPPVPSRPGELHPLGQLLLTAVFQHFSGFEIALHRCCLSCARRAPLRFSKASTVCCQRFFLRAVCCSGAPAGACAPP